MYEIILLSMVCACISYTITESYLFKSFRDHAKVDSVWYGKLVSCAYCLGHWIALVLVSICRVNVFEYSWIIGVPLTIFLIAWLSGFQCVIFCILVEKADK